MKPLGGMRPPWKINISYFPAASTAPQSVSLLPRRKGAQCEEAGPCHKFPFLSYPDCDLVTSSTPVKSLHSFCCVHNPDPQGGTCPPSSVSPSLVEQAPLVILPHKPPVWHACLSLLQLVSMVNLFHFHMPRYGVIPYPY